MDHHRKYHAYLAEQQMHGSPADIAGEDSGEEQAADALLTLTPLVAPALLTPAPATPAAAQSPPEQQQETPKLFLNRALSWFGMGR